MFHRGELTVATTSRGTYDITHEVAAIVRASSARSGLATVFIHHTSASLIICENADRTVRDDLERFAARLVPDGDELFEHDDAGPDATPAHVRSVLTQTSIGIPIVNAAMELGTWQGLYLWEHRTAPHRRKVSVTIIGECAALDAAGHARGTRGGGSAAAAVRRDETSLRARARAERRAGRALARRGSRVRDPARRRWRRAVLRVVAARRGEADRGGPRRDRIHARAADRTPRLWLRGGGPARRRRAGPSVDRRPRARPGSDDERQHHGKPERKERKT